MKTRILLVVSLIMVFGFGLFASPRQQAPKVEAFGSDSPERGTTRVGYWDDGKNGGAGQFAIDYGKPVWRKDYEDTAKFDSMTKGRVWRLGSNFWTVLDTDVPLKIAGTAVPVGYWYLGLKRSSDGAWSLAFIDPQTVKQAQLDASQIGRATVAFEAPMTMEKSSEIQEKLVINLMIDKAHIYQPTLKIAWGNLALSAPIEVQLKS